MFKIVGKTSIDFIALRNVAVYVSGALVALGIFAFVMVAMDKANMGIDFAGGTMIQGAFDQPVTIDEVRLAVEAAGFYGA
ncbi:MAG TPA: protein translocase subunit SecF, partial [candidate division Zixibacteria bacterium]|nr:protein translocase subunit SecF [candidate division Zixibacteria bacterium]